MSYPLKKPSEIGPISLVLLQPNPAFFAPIINNIPLRILLKHPAKTKLEESLTWNNIDKERFLLC